MGEVHKQWSGGGGGKKKVLRKVEVNSIESYDIVTFWE
jgi:hypothetical protein